MTIYNLTIYSYQKQRINHSVIKWLCVYVFLTGFLLSCSLCANAQNNITGLPQSTSNPAIQKLKQSLDRAISNADRDQLATLLQTAKEQHYQAGQAIALCGLAVTIDEQQADESARNLRDAQQIASQVGEMPEVSWAMMELGKVMRSNPSKSGSLRTGLLAVMTSLTHSMQHARLDNRPPTKSEIRSHYRIDTEAFPGARRAKAIVQMIDKNMAGMKYKPDFNFTDDWLDTIVKRDKTSLKAQKQLIAQRKTRDSIKALSNAFAKKGNYAEAYKSFLAYSSYKDSLTAEVSSRRLATLQYNQQLQKKEAEIKLLTKDRLLKEQAASRQWLYMVILFCCIAALSAILFILNRNNQLKKKTNELLNAQKGELETALIELKSTQAQLVHSEKMASLGELTAGIAHEIQNPLNFVNNFSELSFELLHELMENRKQPVEDKEADADLLNDIDLNLQKVSQHGKRASSIIKRMLEHSRTGSGEKEKVDIDTLVDEYLKLAYHGTRARDKSFEVKMTTDLKAGPNAVNILPQEMGRVLLNIFNNGFYAVQQRQKAAKGDFEPAVTVNTYREHGEVIIKIRDNGTGMPEQVMQKIFQPFYTTKPTGEGTGLGLSLCYDIVTKGHGGKLLVTSEEGNYTEFTIVLPA